MATVPIISSPRNQVGKVPNAEQNYGPTAGAFGEKQAQETLQGAQDLKRTGGEMAQNAFNLQEADNRIKAREDALSSITAINQLDNEVNQKILAVQSGGNLADPAQIKQLRADLDEVYSKYRGSFKGQLDGSDISFATELERHRGRTTAFVVENGLKAGKAALSNEATKVVNQHANSVLNRPEFLNDAMATWDSFVQTKIAPGLDPVETDSIYRAGLDTISSAALKPLLASGRYEEVIEKLATDPVFSQNVSAATQLELRIAATNGIVERNKLNNKIAGVTAALKGANLSPEEAKRIAVFTAAGLDLAANQKDGKPAATPLTDPKLGFSFLHEYANYVRSGKATEGEVLYYLSVYQGVEKKDALGNSYDAPAVAREALLANGLRPSDMKSSEGASASLEVFRRLMSSRSPTTTGETPSVPTTPTPGQQNLSRATDSKNQSAQQGALARVREGLSAVNNSMKSVMESIEKGPDGRPLDRQFADSLIQSNIRMFDFGDLLTGLTGAIGAGLSQNEITGMLVKAPETNAIRSSFDTVKGLIESTLRFTDKYANAERTDIKEKLKLLEPSLLGSPDSFRDTMRGLDATLGTLQDVYSKLVEKEGALGKTEAEQIRWDLERIKTARKVLGVPVTVYNREQLNKYIEEGKIRPGVDPYYWMGPGVKQVYYPTGYKRYGGQ